MPLTGDTKRRYQNQWIQKRRSDWIDSRGGKCEICGSTDQLEVDHIDRSMKSMNPRSIWSRREDIRAKELAKCQVLCRGCHFNKTSGEMVKPIEHGTYKGARRGCRCEACRSTIAPHWREYRKKKKQDKHSVA